jgi:serine phosphatase RsbU (regulator of sigma subunit)
MGVTEAVDASFEMFGRERLKTAVGAQPQQPAQALCEQILQLVTAHSGEAAPSDDITLVCVRAK